MSNTMSILPPAPRRDKPKLLDQVCDVIRRKHYSIRTEQAYIDWRVKPWPRAKDLALMHYVYVLSSLTDGGFYIGYSENLRKRLREHTSGASFATSYRGQWKLIYYEAYLNQADALGRERYLKSGGGRRFLKAQLRNYLAENTA